MRAGLEVSVQFGRRKGEKDRTKWSYHWDIVYSGSTPDLIVCNSTFMEVHVVQLCCILFVAKMVTNKAR